MSESSSGTILISTNPSNNYEPIGEVSCTTIEDINGAVTESRKAFKAWSDYALEGRKEKLLKLLSVIKEYKTALAQLTSKEMGMPIKLSEELVEEAINHFQWNLDHAREFLGQEVLHEDSRTKTILAHEPWGVVAIISPWNFPLPNFVVSATQALLAGNTVIMKYSEEVPLFSQYLQRLCFIAGVPEGVISFIYGGPNEGNALLNCSIDMIIFTGSTKVGQELYQKAAEKLIPIIMELGGSSPGVIFEDADLERALPEIYRSRFSNSGQFCDGLKRLIVHRSRFEECVLKLRKLVVTQKVGDPLSSDTDLGPLVCERQLLQLEAQVQDAVEKGAKPICGGQRPHDLQGAYYEPTLLIGISKEMRVWKEEVFGPVLPITIFDTYEQAIELANDTQYGLSGYVYTKDRLKAERALRDIKAGSVVTQGAYYGRPQDPFGGYKCSGIGRTGGREGFKSVCQTKVISMEKL